MVDNFIEVPPSENYLKYVPTQTQTTVRSIIDPRGVLTLFHVRATLNELASNELLWI
jgi:hypothetical protein